MKRLGFARYQALLRRHQTQDMKIRHSKESTCYCER